MEPRPDAPDVAQIIRALEQRVEDLESQCAHVRPLLGDYLQGRLDEALDHLENIRALSRPSVVKEQT